MTLWIVLFAVAALSMILVVAPLWRRGRHDMSRAAFDAQVYRDQLAEVERDAGRGALSPEEAAAARTEIARRLLATQADAADAEAPAGHVSADAVRAASNASRRGIAAFVAVAVPVAAFGVYLIVGSPHLPGRPAAEMRAQLPERPGAPDMTALVARLGEKLKDRPDDLRGWSLYARSLAGLGRFDEAVEAYRKARSLAPGDAETASRLAEAQIFAARGTVTPAAREALDETLALDPKEPRARYYMGLAASQAGKVEEALRIWLALEAESGADAPWSRVLADRIANAAAEGGVAPDRLAERRRQAADAAPRALGPTADDVRAARSMSEEDRREMIRGMVGRLAERLKKEPDDVAGWQRLARSYDVLGEAEKARDAHAQLARLRPDDANVLAGYAAAVARTLPRDAPIPDALATLGDRILALDPAHAGALWFTGLARKQSGDAAGARERWTRLLALLAPDSPQHAEVRKSLDALPPPPSE
jgi:cytochrome c-type biogenesis protein CcmH